MPAASSRSASTFAAAITALVLVALFLAAAVPTIFFAGSQGRGANDQNLWHLPTIRQFAAEWPHPDLRDYRSATTPGYHLALAAAAHVFGSTDERFLRLIGMIFTIALLAVLGSVGTRQYAPIAAAAICMPVLASPYIFASGVWLLPDNAGWLFVLLAMLLALRGRIDAIFYIGVAIDVLALVWVRQPHVWVIAPLLVAAWIGPDIQTAASLRKARAGSRFARIALATLAVLPAIASLAFFFHLWHGAVPPNQQIFVSGGNPATPAAILSIIGIVGIFFVGFLPRRLFSSTGAILAFIGAIAGAVVALAPRTTYDMQAGRWSGLWNLVPHFPVLFGRLSLVIVAPAMAGGVFVALWLAALSSRQRWIWAAALIAFTLAQSANHNAFYRYDEPAILLAAVLIVSSVPLTPPRWALAGPVLLAILLAAVTFLQFT